MRFTSILKKSEVSTLMVFDPLCWCGYMCSDSEKFPCSGRSRVQVRALVCDWYAPVYVMTYEMVSVVSACHL